MELKIGNKTYKLEFTVEASLCEDCVERTTSFMMSTVNAEGKSAVKHIIGTMTDLPNTALCMLYGGLLAHHGEDGDRTVTCKSDAKSLLKQYMLEHKEDGLGNFYDLIALFVAQMGTDGFFDLIGLAKIVQMGTKPKTPKKPQDHKKKQPAKATEK